MWELCDISECLDYKNCDCNMQKKIVNKLVDECTETVEELKSTILSLAENEKSYKCSFYTVCTQSSFTISIDGIGAYFFYFYCFLKKDAVHVSFDIYKGKTIE